MENFKELIEISDILNSPGGCPWDQKQTFASLRPYVLEEAHEVLDAVDKEDIGEMIEELGDLFYTVIFYAKVAEREKKFSLSDIIDALKAKLIRRHPHVFGEEKAESMDDVIKTWNRVKAEEKKERKSALDGIPKTLPSLQRAQKIVKKLKLGPQNEVQSEDRAEQLAKAIFAIVQTAAEEEIDIESAFREFLTAKENVFKELNLSQ
ncbi:MAG: MazG family protein [Verrucomicrobia bacterium]|nr:MazG family protein [Verrucomicrobiota bacterium]